jgi:DNA-binding response OmpR family regulator
MIKPRILVVDDEKDVCHGVRDYLLLRMNCEVAVRETGVEALRALEAEEFHVLLQDLNMPGLDGFSVLRQARARHPELITVVITRLNNLAEIKMVEDLGAVYLAKPFELKTLQMVIERALRKKGGFDYLKQ